MIADQSVKFLVRNFTESQELAPLDKSMVIHMRARGTGRFAVARVGVKRLKAHIHAERHVLNSE